MKPMIEISAGTNKLQNHMDMLSCFLNSATTLYAFACEGIANSTGKIGHATLEYWNDHLVTAFFLFRHAFELSIKALIKEKTGNDAHGHNIKELWESISEYQNVIPEKISKAFTVLEKRHVLNDAQLFRYHVDKKCVELKDMPPIQNGDFDAISDATLAIRQLLLEHIHVRKCLPILKSQVHNI